MATLADRIDHGVLRRAVRERYGRVADEPDARLGFPVGRDFAAAVGYPPALLERLPQAARSFTGVGTPVAAAGLRPGEMVLDLGCGAGLDSVWAAEQVGPSGRVLAVDLAEPMVRAARASVAAAGLRNVVVVEALAEALPLPAASVDVALVNGIFNLAPDKAAIMRELRRVLRPSGRLVACEIVLTRPLAVGEVGGLEDWFR